MLHRLSPITSRNTNKATVRFGECPFHKFEGEGIWMNIYQKNNKLYAEPTVGFAYDESDKVILESPTLRPYDLWRVCAKWVRDYWVSKGYKIERTKPPKDPIMKWQYIQIKKGISKKMRNTLIEAGVLYEKL